MYVMDHQLDSAQCDVVSLDEAFAIKGSQPSKTLAQWSRAFNFASVFSSGRRSSFLITPKGTGTLIDYYIRSMH